MNDFTDFLIELNGSYPIEFRHSAQSVREFMELEGEFIYDLYGTQFIRKSEISSIRLSPVPYATAFHNKHRRCHRNLTELWYWMNSLPKETQEDIKKDWYRAREKGTE